jgi:hypothetical protein
VERIKNRLVEDTSIPSKDFQPGLERFKALQEKVIIFEIIININIFMIKTLARKY